MIGVYNHSEAAVEIRKLTGWDIDGVCDDAGWAGLRIGPVGIHRDSEPLALSNWHTVLALLDEKELEYQVHSFGHWGVGWIEELVTNTGDEEVQDLLDSIELTLSDYPVLDEMDYSRREWENDHPSDGECYSEHCRQQGRCGQSGRFVSRR